MKAGTDPDAPIRLVRTTPTATRLILAGAGLFALLVPAVEFGRALFQPTLFMLPFWVIALGGAFVGGAILLGVLAGDDTVLEVGKDGIRLSRRNPFRRSVTMLNPGDIRAINIRTLDWDSGPDTFAVEVTLGHGRPVGSYDFRSREAAEELAGRLRRALGWT